MHQEIFSNYLHFLPRIQKAIIQNELHNAHKKLFDYIIFVQRTRANLFSQGVLEPENLESREFWIQGVLEPGSFGAWYYTLWADNPGNLLGAS